MREQLVDNTVTAASVAAGVDSPPPPRSRVVVIGGGIVGVSVAYHLAKLGETDVVVLERDRITSGTTWHPAGLLSNSRASHVLTGLAMDTTETYAQLQAESGIDVGFNRRGVISVARTPARMTELRYAADMGHHHGLVAHELDPQAIGELHPLVDPAGLVGGVHFPADGTVNPGAATLALAKVAADAGVQFREGTPVSEICVEDGRVRGVRTASGVIACDAVALCAGLWSAALARPLGANLALHAAEHMWAMTEPIDGVTDDQPFVRDLDGHFYVRPYQGTALIVGAFEPNGKPRSLASLPPDFAFGEFEPDPEHFGLALERARERFPVLREASMVRWLNAPESFTPDGTLLLGETPEVDGLFVAAGMNSQGILMGPGAARALAEWIVEGTPTVDSAELDVGRFAPAQGSSAYLFERTRETLGRLYGMHWPHLQPETARGMRRTPLYAQLEAGRACFGEQSAWERANWFAPDGVEPAYRYSYERPNWFEHVAEEHRAARERVALFDLSSFAKFRVQGAGALDSMQRIFAGDMDVPVGRVVYTTMLNARGGIEVDLTVTRLGTDEFLVIAPTVTHVRTWHWLRRHAAPDTALTDVTGSFATLAVQGPESRAVLAALTDDDLESGSFPWGTSRWIDVAGVRLLALRVSFVGELGWELYPPAESAGWVYDAILAAGADRGIRRAGYFALDTLRSEKGFRHWGADIGPVDNPLDSGLAFTVAWDKETEPIGRAALAVLRDAPRARRMVHVLLEDPEPQLYHGESVRHEGAVVGRVTSGAYGHTLGSAVGLAFVDPAVLAAGELVEIVVAGRSILATLSAKPFYDPDGSRMRA
jgi:4-methylaminobutanoate oxidase (formaldehyde-forming)